MVGNPGGWVDGMGTQDGFHSEGTRVVGGEWGRGIRPERVDGVLVDGVLVDTVPDPKKSET